MAAACLATALGLAVVVENARGDRAWAAVERDLLTRGEKLDFAAFQPRTIPDDQNFFKAPQLARILYNRSDDAERPKLLAALRLDDFHVVEKFRDSLKDFAALRNEFVKRRVLATSPTENPALDVLAALRPMEPLLAELREAARVRPLAALEPIKTPSDPPNLAADTIYRVGQVLGIHAAASIEAGRTDEAFADIVALQRLATALAGPPRNLLNVLVALALHGVAAGAITDGYDRHAWTEPQLAHFQRAIDEFQPLARMGDALRSERAVFLYFLDHRPLTMGNVGWRSWYPRGWVQQNKVAYCRELDAQVLAAFALAPERIFADRLPSPEAPRVSKQSRRPYTMLSQLSLTNIGRILDGYGTTVEKLRLHAFSWAIERHRLAHGRLPASLADLVPTQLAVAPIGIFDGQPLRYETTSATTFRLYALGKNQRDDAGQGDDIGLAAAGGP